MRPLLLLATALAACKAPAERAAAIPGDSATAVEHGHYDTPSPPAPALRAELAEADQRALAALPAGPGRELIVSNCVICHSAALIGQQRKDRAGWEKTVGLMIDWGSPLAEVDRETAISYLLAHYGAVP